MRKPFKLFIGISIAALIAFTGIGAARAADDQPSETAATLVSDHDSNHRAEGAQMQASVSEDVGILRTGTTLDGGSIKYFPMPAEEIGRLDVAPNLTVNAKTGGITYWLVSNDRADEFARSMGLKTADSGDIANLDLSKQPPASRYWFIGVNQGISVLSDAHKREVLRRNGKSAPDKYYVLLKPTTEAGTPAGPSASLNK